MVGHPQAHRQAPTTGVGWQSDVQWTRGIGSRDAGWLVAGVTRFGALRSLGSQFVTGPCVTDNGLP